MKNKTAFLLSLAILALVIYAWGGMVIGVDTGKALTAQRLRSLKYFTVDSNILMAVSALIAVIPMIVYGTFYLGNILLNGRGEWPDTNDWYGFAMWGIPASFLVFVIIAAATWVFALILWKLNRIRK
jgi:hypothetical protein